MQVAVRSYFTAGVAIVGATALVAAPIMTSPPDIQVPGIHAAQVELAAAANPIEQWIQVLQATADNVVGIGGAVIDDPAPALRQLLANQLGYAQQTGTALSDTASAFLTFLTDDVPATLQQVVADIAQGNIADAATGVNDLLTSALLVSLGLLPILSIPGQITDNLSNAVKAITSEEAVVALATGVISPIQGVIAAAGDSGQALVDALGSGDPIGALTAIVNLPAVLTGALLNGYLSAAGQPSLGLLTFDPTGANAGIVQTLLVSLPHLIAAAITPAPVMKTKVADTTSQIASVPDLTATTLKLDVKSKDSGVDTVSHDVAAGTDGTGETDATDGQATTPTAPDTSTKPDNTKDGNKVVPGQVKTGASGQGTPKSPVKAFGAQIKSFLGKLGFKPPAGHKTGAADSGSPATDQGSAGTADPGTSGAGSDSGSGGGE